MLGIAANMVFCGPKRLCRQSCISNSAAHITIVLAGSKKVLCSVRTVNNTSCERRRLTTQPESASSKQVQKQADEANEVIYEGALAATTLHLKRVSITTCVMGLVGLPLMAVLYGASIPAMGQLAVGGTAIFAATGSTAALSYCVSPYVHTLERVASSPDQDRKLIKATTRNIFAWKVETVFNPEKDVVHYTGSRPFCNFIAKGMPMYVHPELIEDELLRAQLVGKDVAGRVVEKKEDEKKKPQEDDNFL